MSHWASTWAYEQPIKLCGRKFVLVALANFADEDGFCYPSQATLAEMTGQDERSVRRHLEGLEESGLIRRQMRRFKGKRTSDGYYLLAPAERLRPYRTNCPPVVKLQPDTVTLLPDTVSADPSVDPSVENLTPTPLPQTRKKPVKQSETHVKLMVFLSVENGGTLPCRPREARALTWLIENHTEQDILDCFNFLKSEEWRTTAVTWQTVQKEIGQWLERRKQVDGPKKRTPTIRERLGIIIPDPTADFLAEQRGG